MELWAIFGRHVQAVHDDLPRGGRPNPHDVAEGLVAQPKGRRPARTVVGAAFGADAVKSYEDRTHTIAPGLRVWLS